MSSSESHNVRLNEELLAKVQDYASGNGMSINSVVRSAVEAFLKKEAMEYKSVYSFLRNKDITLETEQRSHLGYVLTILSKDRGLEVTKEDTGQFKVNCYSVDLMEEVADSETAIEILLENHPRPEKKESYGGFSGGKGKGGFSKGKGKKPFPGSKKSKSYKGYSSNPAATKEDYELDLPF